MEYLKGIFIFDNHYRAMYNNNYIILGGELLDRILTIQFSEQESAAVLKSTVSALSYLHDHGVVHRYFKKLLSSFFLPQFNKH